MYLRVEFTIGQRRMVVLRASRFPPTLSGVCKLSILLAGIRRIKLSLAPTRALFLGGRMVMRICAMIRIQHWVLSTLTQEVSLKEVAIIKLRRLLARSKSSNCTDARVEYPVAFYEAPGRKGEPRRRGRRRFLTVMTRASRLNSKVKLSRWRGIA